MAAMPEKNNRAMPPMTPPMITLVLFAEESLLLMLPLLSLVSFVGAALVEGIVGSSGLPEDASIDLDDDENALVAVCGAAGAAAEDAWLVVTLVSEVGLVELASAVGEIR
jgi:hypothetical protein